MGLISTTCLTYRKNLDETRIFSIECLGVSEPSCPVFTRKLYWLKKFLSLTHVSLVGQLGHAHHQQYLTITDTSAGLVFKADILAIKQHYGFVILRECIRSMNILNMKISRGNKNSRKHRSIVYKHKWTVHNRFYLERHQSIRVSVE